jgi:Tol biopolymer transport system component
MARASRPVARRLLRIAAVTAIAAVAAPVTAQASFPGDNGLIAFARQGQRADSPFFIYTMDASGGQRTQLTTTGSSRNPAWSPDGETIAFDRAAGGKRRALWLMAADGSDQRRISVGGVRSARNPAWSPDGRRLVFQGCRRSSCERDAIFVARLGGGGRKRVAAKGADPVWSPDGRWIAYGGRVRGEDCPTLALVRPSGKRAHAVVPAKKDSQGQCAGAGGIDFSPDSKRLVYFGLERFKYGTFQNPATGKTETTYGYNHAMYTVDASGRNRRHLATRKLEDAGFFFMPFVWAPDGDDLLWRDDRGSFVGRPDGAKRRIAGKFGGGVDYTWQSRSN